MIGTDKEHCFEVAVVGAGHAGVEAALAAARMGARTALFTLSLDALANMPCNPSIGGSGKGHLVYEIDALGGEMGRAADRVTLQSRTLNLGKGAAVHSKRVQADRMAYRALMKKTVEQCENLHLIQAEIKEVLFEKAEDGHRAVGVRTHLGEVFACARVILATGTYPGGQLFVGDTVTDGGPDGMCASVGLFDSLAKIGIAVMRFKTGTPARINRRSLDFSKMEVQAGECDPQPFSVCTKKEEYHFEDTPCHMIYTTPETHQIIKENLHRSALYGGKITGTGPRYCPSIEDKVVRFADKERHQLFVEPTGADTDELYLQGFSTSMPPDVQRKMIRSLPGFENAEIMRYAYAIEYDCIDPTALRQTLEFATVHGLYGAGQVNGTSGYEEAAAQGLVAGVNAVLSLRAEKPLILSRASSYIGTMIDDLVTKGTKEPYRIMTSRSEYRLLLRQDNADLRLSEEGYRVGLLSEERYQRFLSRRAAIECEIARMKETVIAPSASVKAFLEVKGSAPIETGVRLSELLRRPELTYRMLAEIDPSRPTLDESVCVTAELEVKYEGYIKRQLAEVARRAETEELPLPDGLDYREVKGLRLEAIEKLNKSKPVTVGQASRMSGVNPADVTVLLLYLNSKCKMQNAKLSEQDAKLSETETERTKEGKDSR